ncbi:MAG: hypothetical protein IPH48_18915 [bacterium]|nr:hypothetical protein [bacterium]
MSSGILTCCLLAGLLTAAAAAGRVPGSGRAASTASGWRGLRAVADHDGTLVIGDLTAAALSWSMRWPPGMATPGRLCRRRGRLGGGHGRS